MVRSLMVGVALGCSPTTPSSSGDTADTPSGSSSATTGDTGTTAPPEPTLAATCAPTANELRFVCHVSVEPPQAVQITFARADGEGPVRVHRGDLAVREHEIPLYFMVPDTDYVWTAATVAAPLGDSVSGAITTGELTDAIDSELAVAGTSSVPYIGVNDPCDNEAVAVIYDTASGQIVWYSAVNALGTFGFLNMVQFTEDHTVLGETGASVVEVDLAGNERYRLDNNADYDADLHHDLYKKDGYYYLLYHEGSAPLLDGILVYDGAGAQVASWKARDSLPIAPDAFGDWQHTNTVYVDDAGDWYLSSYEQDTVLKIEGDWTDPQFGSLLWAFAGDDEGGFGQDFAIDWSAVSEGVFGHQHDVHYTSTGQLVMLDNPRGRALVFDMDEGGHTARAVGEYPTKELACGPQGTAAMSSTGGVFAGCSGTTMREYAPGGELAWEGTVQCGGGFASVVRFYPLEGW